MTKCSFNTAIVAGLSLLPCMRTFGQLNAFPGAVGFGGYATGGRTGSVVVVKNFNSSGPGSFAAAVGTANSIVVFNVGGYIDLKGEISVASNVTILGQTAPGGGIGLMDGELSFSNSSNDIVDYLRLRQGSGSSVDTGKAAIEMDNASNLVLSHDSIQFGQWDDADVNDCSNITIQSCIFSDAIHQQFAIHAQDTSNFSIISSIFENDHNRNPFIENNGTLQFVNNVIYNVQAGFTSGGGGGTRQEDLVKNYFITGPSTTSNSDAAYFQVDGSDQMYQSGNYEDTSRNGTLNGSVVTAAGVTDESSPWSATTAALPTLSAAQAVVFDTAQAGASLVRDSVDALDIGQVNSFGTSGGTTANGDYLYTSVDQTGLNNGGYGTIANGTPLPSTTGDGIPDVWATAHGMNVSNAAQATALNPLGYTMVEAYANSLAESTLTTRTWNSSSGNWSTTGSWGGTLPGVYDIASVTGKGAGTDGLVTVTSASGAPYIFQLNIGANGTASGEKVIVSSGTLTVYDTITVGNLNTATLEIDGGTVTAANLQIGNTLGGTTYSGSLALNGGVLIASKVALGGGVPGNWTTGGSINWSGGTLQSAGALLVNVPAVLGPGGGILDTNAGTATISSVISGSGPFKVIGGGTLTLTGANTYTNVITVSGATLYANPLSLAGAPGTLGASSNAAGNIILDGGTLGGVGTTDHLFTLTANGGAIDNTGGNGFSNTGNIGLPQANVTLTLTGTNTGHETFSPSLTDPGHGYTTSVVKNGTGMWTFNTTGTKTYSGNTTVNSGTLETLASYSLSPNSNIILGQGTTLELHDSSQAINGLSGSGYVQNYFVAHNDTLTIGSNNGGGTFTGIINSGATLNVTKVGSGLQIFSGNNTYTGNTTISGGTLELLTAAGGPGINILPSATAVALTTPTATLDVESVDQTIASLNGPGGSSVILGGGSILTVSNLTSTEFDGTISGNGSLNVQGGLTLTLGGSDAYTGFTNVSSGALTVEGSLASATVLTADGKISFAANTGSAILDRSFAGITIGSGGSIRVASSSSGAKRTLLVTPSPTFAGSAGAWQGQLDLGSNDAVIQGGSLTTLTNQIKQGYNAGNWNGSGGIISSAAAGNTTHLTALGVIQNSVNGTPSGAPLYGSGTTLGLFDGFSPLDTDVLLKYTYYGDTNLDGKVDGTDYSRIDYGYAHGLTGWYNGDFNYDGVVDGSDYTLMDNAFNSQGATLAAIVATPAEEFAPSSSVPEPGWLWTTGLIALLGRRRPRRANV